MKHKRIVFYSFIPLLLLFFIFSIWYYRLPYHNTVYHWNGNTTIIVYQVKHRPILAPNGNHVEFIAITIFREKILIDLITGSGLENSIRLSGNEAEKFLKHYDISIAGVDKIDGG